MLLGEVLTESDDLCHKYVVMGRAMLIVIGPFIVWNNNLPADHFWFRHLCVHIAIVDCRLSADEHLIVAVAVLSVAPALDQGDLLTELYGRRFALPVYQWVVDVDTEGIQGPTVDGDFHGRAAGNDEDPTGDFEHVRAVVGRKFVLLVICQLAGLSRGHDLPVVG